MSGRLDEGWAPAVAKQPVASVEQQRDPPVEIQALEEIMLMTLAPLIELNDGYKIPQLGLGTWPLDDAQVADAVVEAVSCGYRHIDTAGKYGNEEGVGNGIRACGVDRGELFITTKLDGGFQGSGKAVAGLDGSLERLGLDYVDLLLIHWPLPRRGQVGPPCTTSGELG